MANLINVRFPFTDFDDTDISSHFYISVSNHELKRLKKKCPHGYVLTCVDSHDDFDMLYWSYVKEDIDES